LVRRCPADGQGILGSRLGAPAGERRGRLRERGTRRVELAAHGVGDAEVLPGIVGIGLAGGPGMREDARDAAVAARGAGSEARVELGALLRRERALPSA